MQKKVRLSPHIIPIKYNITIKPDLQAFTFAGHEEISIDVKKPTSQITLHSKELDISAASIVQKEELWAKISFDQKAETASFAFPKVLKKGKYRFKLTFKGLLNDHMRGFYKSSYSHEGKTKHLATSQFEATDARRAFPSFDEPALKAVFEINLIVPENLTAISNTLPSEIKEHEAGYKLISFHPSPKMSTYLVAFIVGEFEFLERKTKSGVIVRVHTTPGKKHQAKFALDCAVKTLEFYNKYFDIPYPLNTLDMVAIPDFAHGAMENWGAITYRESALLVDEDHSSAANKQWVALVIAHELAHQWFGNLVTMEWWTHLWLNEGFASYIEYLAVDHIFPQWDIWTQFAYNDLGVALKLDSLASTHPIEVEVHHPNEIGEIFDEVSYSKGSSVIRMLAAYLGEAGFRDGLRHYLKKHSYQNASTIHLWEAFERISKKPVRKMMQNWTSKPGYPVIKIEKINNNLKFTQQRFFSSLATKNFARDNAIWQTPVGMLAPARKSPSQYLLDTKSKIFAGSGDAWLKINAGETGFFRTNYEPRLLASLAEPVSKMQLPAIDRLGIIRDLFALAKAGEISVVRALEFSENYVEETDYTVWVELAAGLLEIDQLVFDQPYYEKFRLFSGKLFEKIVKKLGWEKQNGESHTAVLLRSLALSTAGYFGDQKVVSVALKKFAAGKINPDVRGVVYNLVAANGGLKEQQKLINLYTKETLHEERNRLGRSLGKFKQKATIEKALDFFMSKQVRAQDTPMMFYGAFGNNAARNLAWKFIQKHWPELLKRYGHGGHLLGRFIKPLGALHTEAELSEVKKFFKTHAHPGADRTVSQALEEIRSNILWLKQDDHKIKEFLNS